MTNSIQFADRVARLWNLRQESVYHGLLEGLPVREQNEAMLRVLRGELGISLDGPTLGAYLIEPEQRAIEHEGRYPFGTPAALPRILFVAKLDDTAPAGDPSMDGSALTLAWFQEEFVFPIATEVLAIIGQLRWEELARDEIW